MPSQEDWDKTRDALCMRRVKLVERLVGGALSRLGLHYVCTETPVKEGRATVAFSLYSPKLATRRVTITVMCEMFVVKCYGIAGRLSDTTVRTPYEVVKLIT